MAWAKEACCSCALVDEKLEAWLVCARACTLSLQTFLYKCGWKCVSRNVIKDVSVVLHNGCFLKNLVSFMRPGTLFSLSMSLPALSCPRSWHHPSSWACQCLGACLEARV